MDIAKLGIMIDSRGVRGATGDLNRFTGSSERAEISVRNLGRAAVASFGAFASFATLQQAARHTLGFKAAMAEVSTLLDTQPGQMDALARSARNLSKEYGTSATSQAQAYYQAISSGATSSAAATKLLHAANKLAIGGVTDVTTGVDILTTAMNAYRTEGLTAAQASDALFVGMKGGKTTITELSASLGTMIPIAKAMGVSFDEVVAGTSALTTQGIRTAEAATGLRAALTAITSPSKQAADLAGELGLQFNSQALAAKGLQGFLADVVAKTGGSSDAMSTLFSSTEATTAALALAGGGSAKFASIMEDMAEKLGATQTAFEKMAGDDLHRFNAAMATFADGMHSVGSVVLSVGIPALEMLASNMNLVVGIGAAAAAMFTARLAVSIGVTFVAATISAVKQSIALQLALGATSKSAAFAGVAVTTFSRALVFLKGALIATGIGALIVGAGYLVGKFLDLVTATGGWGNALTLLGEVAKGVWTGIKSSAKSIAPALTAVWANVKSGFFNMVSHMSEIWGSFLGNLGADLEGIPGLDGFSQTLLRKSSETMGMVAEFDAKAQSAASSASKLNAQSKKLATQGFEQARAAAKKLLKTVNANNSSLDDGETSANALNEALGNIPAAATGAGAGLKKAAKEAKGFHETLKDAAFTAEEFGAKKANILIGGIDSLSNAWGDWLAGGLKNFGGFKDAIVDSFKSMLAQMIALAAKNRIMISLGLGGATGSAASLGSGIVGQGGLLSGLFGGGGAAGGGAGALSGLLGAGSSFLSGASGFATSLFGAGGGFGAASTYLGATLGTATTSIGAFAAAAGAIAAPLLAVAAVFSFFKKKTKLLDSGLRITVDGFDAAIETFKKTQTSRFWGLSKKTGTSYSAASDEVADPIRLAVSQVQDSVVDMASVLGIGSAAFDGFMASIKVSTKGLTDEQIAEKFQEQLETLSDGMAKMVVGGADLALTGETSSQTLARLSSHLQSANASFDLLGFNLYEVSLAGADVASQFVQILGSVEALQQATAFYFQNFYSDQERLATGTKSLTETMRGLGFSEIPQTRAQFRRLVEAMREMGDDAGLAALLKIAPAFAEIEAAAASMLEATLSNAKAAKDAAERSAKTAYNDALTAIEGERRAVVDSWAAMLADVSKITDAARDNAAGALRFAEIIFDAQKSALAKNFAAVEEALKGQISSATAAADKTRSIFDMLDRSFSDRFAAGSEQMRRNQALAVVQSGNTSDAAALERALSTLNDPSEALFGSYVEYARDFARTSAAIGAMRDSASATLSTDEQIVASLESQLEAESAAYAAQQDYLDQQLVALKTQIDLLNGIDNTLQGAIAAIYGSGTAIEDVLLSATELSAEKLLSGLQSNDATARQASAKLTQSMASSNSQLMAAISAASGVSQGALSTLVGKVAEGDIRANSTLYEILGSSNAANLAIRGSGSSNLAAISGLSSATLESGRGVGEIVRYVEASIRQLADASEQERIAQAAADSQINAADSMAALQIEALNHSVAGILNLGDDILTVKSALNALDTSIVDLTNAQLALKEADQNFAAAQLQESKVQSILIADLLAISKAHETKSEREALLSDLQSKLADVVSRVGSEPFQLKILKKVYGEDDRSSSVTLNNGKRYAANDPWSLDRLISQKVTPQLAASKSAYEAWVDAQSSQLDPLRQQIIDLGGVPKFANGGAHTGGWRVVGDGGGSRAWELEHTGPSRIVSNSDAREMLDNRDVVRAIQSLEKQLDDLREETRAGHAAISKNTRISAQIIRKQDRLSETESAT